VPCSRALAVLCALGALLPCTSCGDAQTAPAVPGRGFPGGYGETAARIIAAARTDETVHEQLTYLCDRIGPRPAGSPAYDEAASWAAAEMARDGLDAVRHEPVTIEMWRRGEESAVLLEPGGPRPIAVLGLGRSVATPRGGITGEVVPVRGFDELSRLGRAVQGKIVLFNFPMREPSASAYAEAVAYRWTAAARAARRGAVAALVRSVTTRRLGTPHTGVMAYEDDAPEIPAAAITTEDADLIERLHEAGASPVVKLVLAGGPLPPAASANVVGELRGRELPGEIVLAERTSTAGTWRAARTTTRPASWSRWAPRAFCVGWTSGRDGRSAWSCSPTRSAASTAPAPTSRRTGTRSIGTPRRSSTTAAASRRGDSRSTPAPTRWRGWRGSWNYSVRWARCRCGWAAAAPTYRRWFAWACPAWVSSRKTRGTSITTTRPRTRWTRWTRAN